MNTDSDELLLWGRPAPAGTTAAAAAAARRSGSASKTQSLTWLMQGLMGSWRCFCELHIKCWSQWIWYVQVMKSFISFPQYD
jgi:hypothetical protein